MQGCVRYGTGILGTGTDVVPKLPKYPVPVMSYRTYRSVRHQYWCTEITEVSGTGMKSLPVPVVPVSMSYELTEVSGTGIDVVPNLPKCPVPVTPAVYTGGMTRYVPYRTQPSLYATRWIIKWKKKLKKDAVSWTWKKTNILHILIPFP